MSKLSRTFDFDRLIFSSKVYGRAFQTSLKDAIKRKQIAPDPTESSNTQTLDIVVGDDDISRNAMADALRRKQAASSKTTGKIDTIILAGDDELGKDKIIRLLHANYLLEDAGAVLRATAPNIPSPYAFSTSRLIHQPGVPQAAFLRLNSREGPWAFDFPLDGHTGQWTIERIQQRYGAVVFLIFVVNLSDYNKLTTDNNTKLADSIFWFTLNIANNELPILICFNNFNNFEKELRKSPLQDYMPGYKGGTSPQDAVEFIGQQFLVTVKHPEKVKSWCMPEELQALDLEHLRTTYDITSQIKAEPVLTST